jgi:hypothetical protein
MNEFPASHLLTLSGSSGQRGRIAGEVLWQEKQKVIER